MASLIRRSNICRRVEDGVELRTRQYHLQRGRIESLRTRLPIMKMDQKQVVVVKAHPLFERFHRGCTTSAPRWPIGGQRLEGGDSGPWRRAALLSFPCAFCPLTWEFCANYVGPASCCLPNSAYLIIMRSRAVSDAISRSFILVILYLCRRITLSVNLSRLRN
jgi:hypothetical protein